MKRNRNEEPPFSLIDRLQPSTQQGSDRPIAIGSKVTDSFNLETEMKVARTNGEHARFQPTLKVSPKECAAAPRFGSQAGLILECPICFPEPIDF